MFVLIVRRAPRAIRPVTLCPYTTRVRSWQLANWIVDGEPSVDMIGVDPRRFGVVSKQFAKIKNQEAYEHVFVNHFPLEERPARSEEHTSELQSLMRISYAVFCLNKKNNNYRG